MKIAFTLLLIGCRTDEKSITDTSSGTVQIDQDGDGFFSTEDCNDLDAQIFPGAEEICDGLDNNCDGQFDEDVTSTFYADSDADGYGNPEISTETCDQPNGYVPQGNDCDDTQSSAYPGAEEVCDGIDNDCNGDVDEGLDSTYFIDADGDGFGDDNNLIEGCILQEGISTIGGDCDDSDATISPIANEICDEIDNNCDGTIDENVTNTYYADNDGDGFGDADNTIGACEPTFGYVSNAEDCDDVDSSVNPSTIELCDGADNDCDGQIDEEGAINGDVWYEDGDEDGFGDPNGAVLSCVQPTGYVSNSDDCNDNNNLFYPNAPELCNGFDDDCDGQIDEEGASNAQIWYADNDSDGYGALENTLAACTQPSGYILDNSDCDDADNDIYPGAAEVCDGEDNDCDGNTDESDAIDQGTWYTDNDGDGYGETAALTVSCTQPSNSSITSGDCDDTNAAINPNADELCDGDDNDCDGNTDESDAVDQSAWYEDSDGDEYGNISTLTIACDAPFGYVADYQDCDDTNSTINPGASEVCDSADNNCNGIVDDNASNASTFYLDYDGDGYGSDGFTLIGCDQPASYVGNNDDCDDTNAAIFLAQTEICDGLDNDCNGVVDDPSVLTFDTYYLDDDEDGYGDASNSISACEATTGYVSNDTDCDDSNIDINPDTGCGSSCQDLFDQGLTTDGAYFIDPDGYNTGEDPIEAYCDMTTSGGGWTLCASLTKGYVPSHMLHDEDMYAFQARLNGTNDYVYETDAPARYTDSWNNSEDLNYGQFCRHMGTSMSETWITAKMWNFSNNNSASLKGTSYDGVYSGIYSGNLFLQWFTNSSSSRTFTRLSGNQLYVQANDGTSYLQSVVGTSYTSPYVDPLVGWGGSSLGTAAYTHSITPWYRTANDSPAQCPGCSGSGGSYSRLPYGQTTILNDTSHSFWSGIPNMPFGWSDCTNNGNCDYHESGMGVWLFYVR